MMLSAIELCDAQKKKAVFQLLGISPAVLTKTFADSLVLFSSVDDEEVKNTKWEFDERILKKCYCSKRQKH